MSTNEIMSEFSFFVIKVLLVMYKKGFMIYKILACMAFYISHDKNQSNYLELLTETISLNCPTKSITSKVISIKFMLIATRSC